MERTGDYIQIESADQPKEFLSLRINFYHPTYISILFMRTLENSSEDGEVSACETEDVMSQSGL